MTQPADSKIVPLTALRFKPANSNDAARAVMTHNFLNVPTCSYAKDDGISHYINAESTIDTFPAAVGEHEALIKDIPQPVLEQQAPPIKMRHRLLRSGFALSVLLHASLVAVLTFVILDKPDEAMVEGATVISLVVLGDNTSIENTAEGEKEGDDEIEEPKPQPEKLAPPPPVVKQPIVKPKPEPTPPPPPLPVQASAQDVLKDAAPLPQFDAPLPDILTAQTPATAKIDAPPPLVQELPKPIDPPKVLPLPVPPQEPRLEEPPKPVEPPKAEEKPVEPPVPEQVILNPPLPLEKPPEPKKPEIKIQTPKKKHVDKTEIKKERKKRKGDTGAQQTTTRRGSSDGVKNGHSAKDKSNGATSSEAGNAARSNYKGIVEKKLGRAQSRVRTHDKGSLVLSFTITASGAVSGARISRSSGNPELDAAALTLLDRAAPFPPIPTEAGRKSWPMTVPIEFRK